MYYYCTTNLYSLVYKGLLKFSEYGVYECVGKDVYVNNQGMIDDISYEKWQKYFIPLNTVDISEITEQDEVLIY